MKKLLWKFNTEETMEKQQYMGNRGVHIHEFN